jgi:uncharacterized membrane protein (DUF373 family)
MDSEDQLVGIDKRIGVLAGRLFGRIELLAYIVLGLMLALAAVVGIALAGVSLWTTVLERGDTVALVVTIDRLLFVLMVIEILHTVRVSFRSGVLVCEPFLVVGLIASIRRVLVITLESSQATQSDRWTEEAREFFDATMMELGVLGGLILIMVISIFMLRYSGRFDVMRGEPNELSPDGRNR